MNIFTDYSLWWLLPIALVSAIISFYYYYKTDQKKRFDAKHLRILALLRSLSLFFCLLLLLGIVWETKAYRIEKPLIITLYDSSQSLKNYKDSSDVVKNTKAYQQLLKTELGTKYEFLDLKIGERTRKLDSLSYQDQVSDLANGFKYIKDHYFNRNIGAVILISDGNYNQGVHPMYEAEGLELTPVFSLLVGDTATKKDAIVRSINANEYAFVGNIIPIQALIDFQFIPKGSYSIDLLQDGKRVQTKKLLLNGDHFSQKEIAFEIEAKSPGFHQFAISVSPIHHEFTLSNNIQKCMVEIVDSKRNILFLASAPHPDIAALKDVFKLDKEATIQSSLSNSYQLTNNIPDFVVWYENGLRPNASLFQQMTGKSIPMMLILGPNVSTSLLKNYGLNISAPTGGQQEDVYPVLASSISVFGLSQQAIDGMNSFSPLRTRYGNFKLPSNSIVLVNQRVGTVSTQNPLIAVTQSDKGKLGLILGEGIWRWRLKEYLKTKQSIAFEEFFNKFAQYITIRQNREPLRVKFPNKLNSLEDLIINAEFYNESMELITTPEITFELTRLEDKPIKQNFAVVDNFFQLNAGTLEPGLYKWNVLAKRNGKNYLKSGSFAIDAISIEKQESQASYATLNQLAVQSEGKVYSLKDYAKLFDAIKNRSDITAISFEESGYQNLIDWKWFFLVVFMAIGGEWFLRRWWGSY